MTLPNIVPSPNAFCPKDGFFTLPEGKTLTQVAVAQKDEKITNKEEYRLYITEKDVIIRCGHEQGAFYGLQTLKQIEYQYKNADAIPCMVICDKPHFGHRGFMIDCARHFFSVEDLKKMIEACAMFKFNVFHWHLTDDQGWRLPIDKYSLLNDVSSYRMSSQFGRLETDMRPYGGLYSKEDIREIIAFCQERYIDVIPEFDVPGHTRSILAAYPKLSCRQLPLPVAVRAGIFSDGLCPGKDEVYEFVYDILDEIMDLFPGEYIHIGGDEMPKAHWKKCDDCKKKMAEQGLTDFEDLQGYFTNKVTEYLHSKGKQVIVWNDTLKSSLVSKDIIVQRWIRDNGRCDDFANQGGKIIASDFSYYYTDYPYAMTPLRKTYNFNPVSPALSEKGKANLIGVETPIWTEFVRDLNEMAHGTFPRFAAVAETGWTAPKHKNTNGFFDRFEAVMPMLYEMGIYPAARDEWAPDKKESKRQFMYLAKQRKDWRTFLYHFGKDDYQ